MGDFSNEVAALIGSLTNPRYATQDPPSIAPVLFDGELQGAFTHFVAHPDDPHDYGIAVWNDAQAGLYGPIAPYTPYVDPPAHAPPNMPVPGPDYEFPDVDPGPTMDMYFVSSVKQVFPPATTRVLEQMVAVVVANGGKPPGGAKGAALNQLAVANGMSLEDFTATLVALNDLHFAYSAAIAAHYTGGDKATFKTTMAAAVEEFNAASPRQIKAPT